MKPSFILLPLSFILPSVFAACKTNEKYCGEDLRYNLGYSDGEVLSAAQENTDLPSDARNDRTHNWENVIFNCVDGEQIEALQYCEDPDVCAKGNDDWTGAECKLEFLVD